MGDLDLYVLDIMGREDQVTVEADDFVQREGRVDFLKSGEIVESFPRDQVEQIQELRRPK